MYSPDDVPEELIAGQRESMASKPQTVQDWWTYRYMDEISEEEHRKHAARYWGLVSHLDAQMGRIMDYLEELDMADNTIVIVNSDHGQMTGEHCLVHKGPYMYEGITHIPTLVSWPGRIEPGTRVDEFAEGVDLAPTVLDMLDVAAPDDLHGRSWMPLLDGEAEGWRDAAFIQWEDYVFCIRTDRWKLTWYESDQDGELYDMENDPWETANLFGADECADVRAELMDRLNQWRAEYARPEDRPSGD